MSAKIIKVLTRVSLIFIAGVFLMGYNSEKISKFFLPKVSVYKVRDEKVKTTIYFTGTLVARDVKDVKLSYDVVIDEVFVRNGEKIKKGDAVFSIKNLFSIRTIEEEKEELNLELLRLEVDYDLLSGNNKTLNFRRIELMKENINQLKIQLNNLLVLLENNLDYQNQVDDLKKQIAIKNVELDDFVLDYSESAKKADLEVISMLSEIHFLKEKINNLEIKRNFYDQIDEDGIYRSSMDGVVTDLINENQQVLYNTVILSISGITDYTSYYYHGSFDKKNKNLIQKGDLIKLIIADNITPIECRITKVYEVVGNKIAIDADISAESDYLLLGAKYDSYAIERPDSPLNVPRNSIVSRGEIKIGAKVDFFVINESEGVLGTEYVCMLGSGTVAYVGDDLIGLSEKTIPQTTEIVITNPSSKLKSGDKVDW